MTFEKKPGLLGRAKQLADRLFTKRNMALAVPVVVGAAALGSKRVRDAVGDAAKSAGDALVTALPAREKPGSSDAAKPAAKRSATSRAGAVQATANSSTKPAAAKAAKAPAARKAKAKPRAKASPALSGDQAGE